MNTEILAVILLAIIGIFVGMFGMFTLETASASYTKEDRRSVLRKRGWFLLIIAGLHVAPALFMLWTLAIFGGK